MRLLSGQIFACAGEVVWAALGHKLAAFFFKERWMLVFTVEGLVTTHALDLP